MNSIKDQLYKHYAKAVDISERGQLLDAWRKKNRSNAMLVIFTDIVLVALVCFVVMNHSSDRIMAALEIFIALYALAFDVIFPSRTVYQNIQGYKKCQAGHWTRTLVYIDTFYHGKIDGRYVLENGQLYEGRIHYQFGGMACSFRVQSFATLYYFESLNKYMLSQDYSWTNITNTGFLWR